MAKELRLDWHTVKALEQQSMREQLQRAGTPEPRVIGLDEVPIKKGQTYRIVVSDLVRHRPIWFGGTDRSEASLDQFSTWLGPRKTAQIRLVVMDMWKPFRLATAHHAPQRLTRYTRPALLVLDDFGLKPLRAPGPEDLYDVINERYERGSILLTSNRDRPSGRTSLARPCSLPPLLTDRPTAPTSSRLPARVSGRSTPRNRSPPAAPAAATERKRNLHGRAPVTSPHWLHMGDPEWLSLGDR